MGVTIQRHAFKTDRGDVISLSYEPGSMPDAEEGREMGISPKVPALPGPLFHEARSLSFHANNTMKR
jgi:hypothetical protein